MEDNNNLDEIELDKNLDLSKNNDGTTYEEGAIYEKSTDDQIYELEDAFNFRGDSFEGPINNSFWDLNEDSFVDSRTFEREQHTWYSYVKGTNNK